MDINNLKTELLNNLQSLHNQSDNSQTGSLPALLNLIKEGIYNVEHQPPGCHVMVVAICPNSHHANTIYIPEIFFGYFFNNYIEEYLNSQENGY